jgi:membrane-bound metal-dependent hydrolase YbcI (DUF457 family)
MPLAVTHVLLTIIALDLYRDYVTKDKKKFSLWTVLIGGIAGLLPDIDIPLNYVLSNFGMHLQLLEHGGITHTPFFGMIFLVPAAIFWMANKHRLSTIFVAISFGIIFHFFLDFLIGGGAEAGVAALWPFSDQTFKVFLAAGYNFPISAGLDAIILLAWLFHEYKRHKIKDFI